MRQRGSISPPEEPRQECSTPTPSSTFPTSASAERAFNMLEQKPDAPDDATMPGRVVAQTHAPTIPVINFLHEHDYKASMPTRLKSAVPTTLSAVHTRNQYLL